VGLFTFFAFRNAIIYFNISIIYFNNPIIYFNISVIYVNISVIDVNNRVAGVIGRVVFQRTKISGARIGTFYKATKLFLNDFYRFEGKNAFLTKN
jgi:hypothetical protein